MSASEWGVWSAGTGEWSSGFRGKVDGSQAESVIFAHWVMRSSLSSALIRELVENVAHVLGETAKVELPNSAEANFPNRILISLIFRRPRYNRQRVIPPIRNVTL